MSAMTTFAPSSTSRRVIALPISPAPPVMTTTLSFAEIGIRSSVYEGDRVVRCWGDRSSRPILPGPPSFSRLDRGRSRHAQLHSVTPDHLTILLTQQLR